MAIPTLDSLTDNLFETVNSLLEDPITYTPDGGSPLSIRAWVDHEDKTDAFGGVQVTAQDIFVEVLKSDVATVSESDVITLPELGQTFSPVEWKNTRSGRGWVIWLRKVRA